jgi:hypothetical protein
LRQEPEQPADFGEALVLGVGEEMGHAAFGGMDGCTAQVLMAYLLVHHRLDYVWAGDIHLPDALDHKNEIGQGRGVDRTSRGRTDDNGYLGHDARGECVGAEHVSYARQTHDSLLDAGPAGIEDGNYRGKVIQGKLHKLLYFLADDLRDGPAEDRKVL